MEDIIIFTTMDSFEADQVAIALKDAGRTIMNRDKKACTCKDVTYGMVEDAVKNGAKTYEEVQEITGFGTGCGKCRALYFWSKS